MKWGLHLKFWILVTLVLILAVPAIVSAQDREHGHGSMMMGGMMGGCPMMGGSAGLDSKTAMRMHAEMMRAMSDIMMKYSDQAGAAPSK